MTKLNVRSWSGALLAGVPAGIAGLFIWTYGVNAAHWDHLTNAELFDRYRTGTLTFEYLFRPHLEHVKVFPRLVCLAIGLPTRFNNVAEMYVQWVLALLAWVFLYLAIARRVPGSRRSLVLAFVPVSLLLFNFRQYQSMLVGDGMITFMCLTSTTAAIAALAAGRTTVAAAATLVASLSHANGFLLWPIGLLAIAAARRSAPAGSTGRRTALPIAIWVSAAALAIAALVINWPQGAGTQATGMLARPLDAVRYAVHVGGTAFAGSPAPQKWWGLAVGLLEVLALARAAWEYRQRRPVPVGAWLVLFSGAAQFLISLGRASLEPGIGVPSRYAVFVGIGIAGAYLTVLEAEVRRAALKGGRHEIGRPPLMVVAAAVFVVAGCVSGYRNGLQRGPEERDGRLRIAQILRTVQWQNDEVIGALLYPFPAHGRAYAGTLQQMRYNVFADPLPDPAGLPQSSSAEFLVDTVNFRDSRAEPVQVQEGQTIALSGWAFDKVRRVPFKIAFARFEPAGLTLPVAYGFSRPDVARAHRLFSLRKPRRVNDSGWGAMYSTAVLRPGRNTVSLLFVTRDGASVAPTGVVATFVK